MKLDMIISEGETILRDAKKSLDPDRIKARKNRWVKQGNEFLNQQYPTSVITQDFTKMSSNTDPNLDNMVSILKGLRDVEDDLGLL